MKIPGLIVIGCLLLAGCSNSRMKYAEVADSQGDGFALAKFEDVSNTQAQSPVTIERKLIKNGSIEFEVSKVNDARNRITDLVKDAGGYISSDNQNNYSGSPRYEQVIRVPAEKLDDLVSKIEGFAKKVDNKTISTQDVTEEFIDVETRLATKKELEARYRELLKQAKSVKDIIEVEAQLNNVRSEIESMEGRLKYLNSQVSYSTLTVTYYQAVSGNYGFGYRFFSSFGQGWTALLDFIIGIFTAWPFIIMIGVGIWLFIRWRRKRNQVQ